MAKQKSAKDLLVEELITLSRTQGLNTAFNTFLEITATSLAAQLDPIHFTEREERYEELVSHMKPEIITTYARMFALLYLAIFENENEPCDVLGQIFHESCLNSVRNGQIFTPDDVCRLMASLTNPINEFANQQYPITISDPTCGSGNMIIAAVWYMKQKKFDFKHKSLFIAQDNDIRCVWMTYIQLTLYHIPAVVIHGDSLSMENWSQWYTPKALVFLTQANTLLEADMTNPKTNDELLD